MRLERSRVFTLYRCIAEYIYENANAAYKRRHFIGTVIKKRIVMAGKYTPLENYLRDLPESQREVTLRFEEIERILNSR
jgi:hypothetical protein